MSSLNPILLKKNSLTQAIQILLYKNLMPSVLLIGSCLTSVYAQEQLSKTLIDQAIQQQEQKQSELIQDVLTDQINAESLASQKTQEDIVLEANKATFSADPIYDFNDIEIPEVDQNMLKEIYDVAEQAQKEVVEQSTAYQTSVEALVKEHQQNVSQEVTQTDQQVQQVEALVKQLAADPIEMPVISKDNVTNADGTEDLQTSTVVKRTWLDRLLRRDPINDMAMPEKLPKISVRVVGAEERLEDNIEAMLSNFTVEAFNDFDSALPQLKTMTERAAHAVGYYKAKFTYRKLDENSLEIMVAPDEPVKVTTQNIEITGDGKTRPAFRVIPVVPDLRVGDILDHGKYESTKARIETAASDSGYFDSYWRMHDVKVSLPENTADIQLKYETEKRYLLRDVEFRMSGTRKEFPLRSDVLQKLVPFKDNDEYSNWRINGLTSNLTNTRYFNNILVNVIKPDPIVKPLELPEDLAKIEAEQRQRLESAKVASGEVAQQEVTEQKVVGEDIFAGADQVIKGRALKKESEDTDELELLKIQAREEKKIPVIVYLNADELNNVEAGIGYGTDTGVRLRTQYRRAIVNDRGHSFDANIELSRIRQSLDGRYMIPYKDPLNDYINLIGGYEREARDQIGQGIELDIESAVLGAERLIKRPLGNWQHTMSLRYRLDRIDSNGEVDINDIPDAFRIITSSPEQESLLFGYEISKTTQNNRANPTQGFRQFYRAEIGSESLLTETDVAIINAGWRFIYSLGDGADHQFVGRADLGYIVTNSFDKVPYNLRYFAGGDQSIRGFDYKSLSPREDDLLLGGQSLAVGSLEYNYQFKEGWRAAIFADVGNAYDEKFTTETKYGAGVGVRWASPVGPIRIDVAAGVSETNVPIRLHFFIGPAL